MNRDINNIDDDIVAAKRLIRERLVGDPDVIEAIHNLNLDPECPDDYIDVNILSHINLPGTQDTVQNYICFAVDDIEADRYNQVMKTQYVQFVIFVHEKDIKTPYGIDRHDLLGYLIRDLFNWSNLLGMQMKLINNKESVTDNNYACRTLKFELTKTNSLQKGVTTNKYEFTRR